jgi:hypothetical protein
MMFKIIAKVISSSLSSLLLQGKGFCTAVLPLSSRGGLGAEVIIVKSYLDWL